MTFQNKQRVLVDTNVIIEAHRTGCWTTIANYFALETVEKVVEETQTGAQNRSPETHIDYAALRASLQHIEAVTEDMRAAFHSTYPNVVMDAGERDLLVYAGTIDASAVWFLNSPDMAAVRHAHTRGWLDRLVSLESMNAHLKGRLKDRLADNFTESWLSNRRTRLLLS